LTLSQITGTQFHQETHTVEFTNTVREPEDWEEIIFDSKSQGIVPRTTVTKPMQKTFGL